MQVFLGGVKGICTQDEGGVQAAGESVMPQTTVLSCLSLCCCRAAPMDNRVPEAAAATFLGGRLVAEGVGVFHPSTGSPRNLIVIRVWGSGRRVPTVHGEDRSP